MHSAKLEGFYWSHLGWVLSDEYDAFDQNGEMAASTELRRRFPGLSENAGLEAARMIVRWRPPQNDGATGDASAYK